MASRDGPMVSGTDGSDFVHRETVAPHYQISALNKGRLRKCVFSHLLLALLMLIKMVPDILDRLDIFILEIEELEVPQPLKWEYIWLMGSLASFLGLTAIRKNRVLLLQIYFGLVNLLSTVPILLAAMIYFKEFVEYCTEEEPQGLQLWQGYPISVLWYSFILVAMQVHIFTLIFAWKLILAWKNRGATKKAQCYHMGNFTGILPPIQASWHQYWWLDAANHEMPMIVIFKPVLASLFTFSQLLCGHRPAMEQIIWSKDAPATLCELYLENKCLWDTRDEN